MKESFNRFVNTLEPPPSFYPILDLRQDDQSRYLRCQLRRMGSRPQVMMGSAFLATMKTAYTPCCDIANSTMLLAQTEAKRIHAMRLAER